jgi:hypothetical protein
MAKKEFSKATLDKIVRYLLDDIKKDEIKRQSKLRAVGEGYQITDKNPTSTRQFANSNPEEFHSADTSKFGPDVLDRTPEGDYPKIPVFDSDVANATQEWSKSGNRSKNLKSSDARTISQTEANLPTDARVTDNVDIRKVEDAPIVVGNRARGRDTILSMDEKLDKFIEARVGTNYKPVQRLEDTIDGKLSKLTDMYVEIEASKVMSPQIKAQLLKKLTDKMLKMQNKEILSSKNANRSGTKISEPLPKERVQVGKDDYYMGGYEGEPVQGINMSVDKQLERRRKYNAGFDEVGEDKAFESELNKLFDDINKQGL